MKLSFTELNTNTISGATHAYPELMHLPYTILIAATYKLTLESTTAGFLPPSSKIVLVRCSAAALATNFPF